MLKKLVLVMLTALLVFAVPVSAHEEVMELDEVVVTASRYQESIMETPVSIEVIDQEEIEQSSARNLADLLDISGSIHIKDNGGLTAKKDILLRGMRGDQILILLDGQPFNNPNNGEVNLAEIPVGLIEKVEILKSSSSAVYGANAVGGVINIISKNAQDFDKTELELSAGSYDTRSVNLSTAYNSDSNSLLFIYDKLLSDGYRKNSSIDREDIFTKYRYQFNKNTDLKISFKYNDSLIDYPGSTTGGHGTLDSKDQNIYLTLNQNFDNKNRQISVFNNNKDLYAITYDYSYITEADVNRSGLTFKEIYYSKSHTLSYGLDFLNDQVDAETSYAVYDEENLNKAFFIQDKFNLNNKNIIDFGLRYDDHEEYGSELSPKFGYIYKIKNNLNLNFTAAQSFRAPSFIELYGVAGNQELKAEQTDSYDIGLKYNSKRCFRQLSFFKRNIENMISYNSSSFKNENIAEAYINGVELNIERNLTDNFNIAFAYTYLDAENKNGEQLLDMPYHNLNLNLLYKINKMSFALENNFVGERDDYSGTADSYFVSDLKISRDLNTSNKLSLEVNNLFDKEYEVVLGYPMPGRNFMVNLSTKF